MEQSIAGFDQFSAAALLKSLPPFSAEMPWVDRASSGLLQYLDFYQLPIPRGDIKLRAGEINQQGQTIATLCWAPENPVGSVIIVHGYMDHIGLFNHLIEHLLGCQLNVICFDLPGHGLSAGQPGFILDYADYVGALNAVVSESQAMFNLPLQAIGQSMGGAVLLKHLMTFDSNGSYPFTHLNLLAPLLKPKGWGLSRWLFSLMRHFRESSKRQFRPSSFDLEFLAFVKDKDPVQPRKVPMVWVGALNLWIKEFDNYPACAKLIDNKPVNKCSINLIQGTGDKTLDWEANLIEFKRKLPNLKVQLIPDANHHLVNEIEPLRRTIFAALKL